MARTGVWRLVGIACLLGAAVCPAPVFSAETARPEFAPLFHLPFDGSAAAAVPKDGVTVTGDAALGFAEGKTGKAADFREGGCLEYRGLPPLDTRSGTLELWIKPAHDRKELQDHYYLQFLGKDGAPLLEVKFYHVEMAPQVIARAAPRLYSRYGWSFDKDQWNHIVVTWDDADPDLSGLQLYLAGAKSGYPCAYLPIAAPVALRVGGPTSPAGTPRQARPSGAPAPDGAKALIEEVCVYNRSLTPEQVKLLYESGGLPFDQKLARMRERIAHNDDVSRRRADALFNHRKLAMIHGRNTSLLHWPDEAFKPLRIPVPDKVHETELTKKDLRGYDTVIVPGGGGLNLTPADKEVLLRYVREGGGYVGICGGACAAKAAGLITAQSYSFGVRGSVWVTLKPHAVTEAYDPKRKILFPHASGPLFVPEDKSEEAAILFDVGSPPLPPFAHTIVKQYGKGRIVAFSGHPEGSGETRPLLRNAVLWTTKITGIEGAEQKTGGR